MGCSQSSQTTRATAIFSTKIIKEEILNNSNISPLISAGCFVDEISFFDQLYQTPSQQAQLILIVLGHLNECIGISLEKEVNFQKMMLAVSETGKKLQKLRRQILFEHKSFLKILNFLNTALKPAPYGNSFFNFKFQLMKEEVLEAASITRKLCDENLSAFGMLSNYLLKSCKKLNIEGKKVEQINKILSQKLQILRKQFPPGQGLPSSEKNANQIASLDNSKQYNKMVPVERKDDIEEYILEQNEKAKKSYPKLVMLTSDLCRKYGYNYKTDVKIKGRDHKIAIQRVIQKVFKKLLEKQSKMIQIPEGLTVSERIKAENQKYEQILVKLQQNMSQPILFSISDLIRGKCLYTSIQAINLTARKLIEKCKEQGFIILQIDNRLAGKTTDLVFKILIDETIAEFQLALKFNVVQNQFNHKIYEIARSKIRSPISMLDVINSGINFNLFGNLGSIYQKIISLSEQQQEKIFCQEENFTSLKSYYERFIQQCGIEVKNQGVMNKEEIIRKWDQIKEKSQKSLSQGKQDKKSSQLLLDGIFLYELGKFDEALQKISQSQSCLVFPQDQMTNQFADILKYRGLCLKGKADFHKSIANLEKNIEIVQKMKKDRALQVAEVHNQIGNCYGQLKNHRKSIKSYEECIKIIEQNQNQMSSLYVQALTNKGISLGLTYDLNQQYKVYQKALEICLKLPNGSDHPALGNLYVDLAVYYIQHNNLKLGRDYLDIAISIFTKVKGKNCIENAGAYQNLGAIEKISGRKTQALKYFIKSLEIFTTIYHPNHIQCANLYYNIAKVQMEKMDFMSAQKYFNKFLQAHMTTHGQNNQMCCNVHEELGNNFYQRGKFNQASISFDKSLKIMNKVMPHQKQRISAVCAKGMDASMKIQNYDQARYFYRQGIAAANSGRIFHIAKMLNGLENQLTKIQMVQMPMIQPSLNNANPIQPSLNGPSLNPPFLNNPQRNGLSHQPQKPSLRKDIPTISLSKQKQEQLQNFNEAKNQPEVPQLRVPKQ